MKILFRFVTSRRDLRAFITVVLSSMLIFWSLPATASMGGQIDYSNDRIVPIFDKLRDGIPAYSGYLYSPRIIFSAAHSLTFVGNYVGLPSSKADGTGPKVKIIKKILAPEFNSSNLTRDFAVFILEKDLIEIEPARLMTPEIEKELLKVNSLVKTHGYGIYHVASGCASGNINACNDDLKRKSIEPRMVELRAYSPQEIRNLTKTEVPEPIKQHFLMFTGTIAGGCSGDSGGSITAEYQRVTYYVGPTPNGMNVYACGVGGGDGSIGVHYSSQIYNHLDILKEAEDFVMAAKEQEKLKPSAVQTAPSQKTIVCIKKGKTKKVTAISPKCPTGFKRKK